jgi:predicted metal-dependent hydrolase
MAGVYAASDEETRTVALRDGDLTYTLRRSARARRLRITIDAPHGLLVTIPTSNRRGWAHPDRTIEAFLVDRERWIRRHLDRQAREQATLAARGGIRDGATLRFRGELHRLRVEWPAGIERSTVTREGGTDVDELIVRLAPSDRRPIERVLLDAMVTRARLTIDAEISRHASALGVNPKAVSVRDQRTRWGSASRAGRLNFSWRLILAPPEALETVVIHELAHLRVFGHGPRFWALVASRRSDHATWRRWLREHSNELHGTFDASTPEPALQAGQLELADGNTIGAGI